MPASEAGRNDDDVSSVAGDDDDSEDANDENQNHRYYSNAIEPEVIDSDVSMSGEYVNDGNEDDRYYDASDTSDDEGMDEDGNNVTEDEDTFEDASMDEANSDDNSNESNDDQPSEEQPRLRTRSGRASVPYDHDRKAGSRSMSRPAEFDGEVNGLLLFTTEHTPVETQFFNAMMELGEYQHLNVSLPSNPCSRSELQLVGATGTKFKNTKDLESKNYNEMMESSHKEEYEEGIDVEHEKFVKFECLEETLKKD